MKLKLRDKIKIHGFNHRKEFKEELKNNSIVLSFAVSIIIIGIFSIFSDNSYSLSSHLKLKISLSVLRSELIIKFFLVVLTKETLP